MRNLPLGQAVLRTSSSAPAANSTAAVGTLTGHAGEFLAVDSIVFSYDGTPTNGSLIVQTNFVTVFALYVSTAGKWSFRLPRGLYKVADTNKRLFAILSAGGAGVKGTVTITYR
jgi:hypothetical protein